MLYYIHLQLLVWKTVLFLYMEDPSLPLPTYEEVVVCTENTSIEEVCSVLK